MIRQYRIITKSVNDAEPTQLEPVTNATLYNLPEIRSAVDYMRTNETTEMVGIRLGQRFYSVVATYAEELQPGHFEFVKSVSDG